MHNLNKEDTAWDEFSTLEVAACIHYSFFAMKQKCLA